MGCDLALRRSEIARNMTVSPPDVQPRLAAGGWGGNRRRICRTSSRGHCCGRLAAIHTGRRAAPPFTRHRTKPIRSLAGIVFSAADTPAAPQPAVGSLGR